MVILPKRLKKGGTIGLVSPSAPLAGLCPHRVEACQKALGDLGFKTRLGEHALSVNGYLAGSAKARAEDINSFFQDPEIDAIMCFIGGYNYNQILPHIDFDSIIVNPKPIVGYSDATILLNAIYVKTGLVSFYGPAGLTQFGEYPAPFEYTKEYFIKVLCNSKPAGIINSSDEWTDEVLNWFTKDDLKRPRFMKKNDGIKFLRKGTAEGILLGGCLASLVRLRGTEFWPNFNGSILCLETPEGSSFDKGYDIAIADAELTDLANSGVFEKVSGVIVGRPFAMQEDERKAFYDLVYEKTEKNGIPLVIDMDFGHTDPVCTLPIGGNIIIDSFGEKVEITSPAVV